MIQEVTMNTHPAPKNGARLSQSRYIPTISRRIAGSRGRADRTVPVRGNLDQSEPLRTPAESALRGPGSEFLTGGARA